MLLARALYPAMLERGSGHLVFVASLSGKAASPALLRSTTRPSSACAASPSACAPTSARRGSASRSSRRASIREAGMFADSGAKPPPALGTAHPEQVAAAVVKAIEREQGRGRGGAAARSASSPTSRLASPGIAVRVAERRRRPEGGRRESPTGTRRTRGRPTTTFRRQSDEQQRFLRRPFDPRGERARTTRSSGSTRCRSASTSPACPTRSRCCWRTCCGSRTASRSAPPTSRRSPAGTRPPSPASRSPSSRPGC